MRRVDFECQNWCDIAMLHVGMEGVLVDAMPLSIQAHVTCGPAGIAHAMAV